MSVLISVSITAGVAHAYTDVNTSTDYYESITWMTDNGILEGYPDDTFRPLQCVNRVELLKILYEMRGEEVGDAPDVNYTDTGIGKWYRHYLNLATQQGVVNGYPDGSFRPEWCVNRVEAVKMAMKSYYPDGLLFYFSGRKTVADADPTQWYYDFLMKAFDRNVLGTAHEGVNGAYSPAGEMSRGEVAEMFFRLEAVRDNEADFYEGRLFPLPPALAT